MQRGQASIVGVFGSSYAVAVTKTRVFSGSEIDAVPVPLLKVPDASVLMALMTQAETPGSTGLGSESGGPKKQFGSARHVSPPGQTPCTFGVVQTVPGFLPQWAVAATPLVQLVFVPAWAPSVVAPVMSRMLNDVLGSAPPGTAVAFPPPK